MLLIPTISIRGVRKWERASYRASCIKVLGIYSRCCRGRNCSNQTLNVLYSTKAVFLEIEKRAFRIRLLAPELKQMPGQKPVAKFNAGQVSAAIWENEITVNGRQVTMLKARVQRRYCDKDGTWKSSGSFSRNEIPLAIYCLEKSFQHMIEGQKEEGSNGSVEEEVVE